jgi:hypothetical protein
MDILVVLISLIILSLGVKSPSEKEYQLYDAEMRRRVQENKKMMEEVSKK